jgi:hypothetical protein
MVKTGKNLHRLFGYPIAIDRASTVGRGRISLVGPLVVCKSREWHDKLLAGKTEKPYFGLKFSIV